MSHIPFHGILHLTSLWILMTNLKWSLLAYNSDWILSLSLSFPFHYEKVVELSLPGTYPMPGRCPGEKSGSNPSQMTHFRLAVWIIWRSVAYPFSTPLQLSWWHWGQLLQRLGALLFAHSEQMSVPFRASLTQRDQLSLQQLLASVPVRAEGGVWSDEEMGRDLRRERHYGVLYFLSS